MFLQNDYQEESHSIYFSEMYLLSCIFLAPKLMPKLEDSLKIDDFEFRSNGRIFQLAQKMYDENCTLDAGIFIDYLDKDLVNHFLNQILKINVDLANFDLHLENVTKNKIYLRVQNAGKELSNINPSLSYEQISDKAESLLLDLVNYTEHKSYSFNLAENIDKIYDEIFSTDQCLPNFDPIPFNLIQLRKSEVTVVAARPGVGKTAFAVSTMVNACLNNMKVAFFSFEMSDPQIVLRVLAFLSNVDLKKIKENTLNENEILLVNEAKEKIKKLDKLYLINSVSMSILDVKTVARNLLLKSGLDLIILDYVQLIRSSNKRFESSHAEISAVVQEIKHLANQLSIPILLLSQLSRISEQQQSNTTPLLSHLKASGSIEEHCDNVILLQPTNIPTKIIGILAKQRNGPTGQFNLFFNNQISSFTVKDQK